MNNYLIRGLASSALFAAMLIAPSMASAATLTRQLELGMSGEDVSAVQTFLAQDNTIYPQGLVTGYFGFLTKAAVSNFQLRNGIDSIGRIGPITMAALNSQMGGTVSLGSDVQGPYLYQVAVTTARDNATVSWLTNENTRGVVYYDTSRLSEYEYPHSVVIGGNVAMTDNTLRAIHSVNITGLQPNTVYFYDVYATDAAGNSSMTMQSTFRTLP